MPVISPKALREELKAYGVASENVRTFGQSNPKPELQEYLTLNDLRRKNQPAPDGVAEYQGRPVLYFVDERRLTSTRKSQTLFPADQEPDAIPVIFRQLACRGERAYLARLEFGKLRVAPISPAISRPEWAEYTPGSLEGRSLFSRLAFGLSEGEDFAAGDAIFDRLFRLLKHVANKIAKNVSLRPDALSLVGRSLFFRFLFDRGVLNSYPVSKIAPKALDWTECFRDARNAASTCAWLDKTFNGDFLPLTDNGSQAFFERIGQLTDDEIFKDLSAIIRGHEPQGNDYQPLLNWDWQAFDFAHIPVGLLSQVYEAFSWEWTPKAAKETSQRYTPRNIAVTLLEEVFDNLPNVTTCRVLDPACGAGVFLVLAFRRIYLEHWRRAKNKKRPGTAEIRRILEQQLVGLDISEAALKLAALSLYLTAIELDPEPTPPDKLRFKNLRSYALHNASEPNALQLGSNLGSLGAHLGTRFENRFDVVVSNPPWTSVDGNLGERMESVTRDVISRAGVESGGSHRLPDNNPDLPFLWKATEWCKPNGRIAMALHARILLKTESVPSEARATLFKSLQIDGVINGTNLADTLVWPHMNQPWILLFATNKRPSPHHSTYFVTLPLDLTINKTGTFRMDSESARPIDTEVAANKPWIWKALSVGTRLDVDVLDKLNNAGGVALNKYWTEAVGKYRNGKGYQVAEKQNGIPCSFLTGLPHLDSTSLFRFEVDASALGTFSRSRLWRPRKTTIYDAPLVVIKQSPGEDRSEGRALLSFNRLAYSEIFNGYSAAGHAEGELLVRYLHLFIHSDVWQYYLLATSPEFGAERRRSRKSDLDNCPIVPFERLKRKQKQEVKLLSEGLTESGPVEWEKIDAFFGTLYGLSKHDLQVIRDTLAVSLPFDTARRRACAPPTSTEMTAFVTLLKQSVGPIVKGARGDLMIEWLHSTSLQSSSTSPFSVFVLSSSENAKDLAVADSVKVLDMVIHAADETGATQIVLTQPGALLVGLYNQYRYWTPSRARILAGDIIRLHLDAING